MPEFDPFAVLEELASTIPSPADEGLPSSPQGTPSVSPEKEAVHQRAQRNRTRVAGQWAGAQVTAERMLDESRAFARAARRLPDARARVLSALAPLVLYAEQRLGNSRPQTLLGLIVTLEADHADRRVVGESGDVAIDSTLYRVLDLLMDLQDQGVPEPYGSLQRFLDDEHPRTLWPLLRAAAGARVAGANMNGDTEYSSLNFEVPATTPTDRTVDEVLAELDSLTGLAPVKQVMRQFAAVEQATAQRAKYGLKAPRQSRHMLFLGNPGTGKTTVARLVADLLRATGALPDARLVEADRSLLVGEWLGSTAMKTRKVADAALGGVLFIDEAYSLAGSDAERGGDRFGHEALDTLIKIMEDDRDDLVVILAGYPEPMERLLAMNPGLASRIGITVRFPDLDDDDLVTVFTEMAAESEYELGEDALVPVREVFRAAARDDRFGNARAARSLLEAAMRHHALRVSAPSASGQAGGPTVRDLFTLRFADTASACAEPL